VTAGPPGSVPIGPGEVLQALLGFFCLDTGSCPKRVS
jgi:hypothetical protein